MYTIKSKPDPIFYYLISFIHPDYNNLHERHLITIMIIKATLITMTHFGEVAVY